MPKHADDTKLFIMVKVETMYEKLKKSPKRSNGFSQWQLTQQLQFTINKYTLKLMKKSQTYTMLDLI